MDRRGVRRGERHEPALYGAQRGRPDLERQRMAEVQRERILGAMVELTRELGAERVTVAHVVTRAGVSRRTFYELFTDREDCFQAALEQAIEWVTAVVVPAYRGEQRWCDRIRCGLTAMLELFDEQPAMAALCVIDALGAGPRALERRAQVVDRLVDAIDRGRREAAPGRAASSRIAAEGAAGAVLAILHARLLAERPKPLLGLRGQLMAMIVLPYLGPEAAAAEQAHRVPRVRRPRRVHEDPLRGLKMRLTYRTMRVLAAIGAGGGLSNSLIARDAGIADQGQISKLLQRLEGLGLIHNACAGAIRGEPNAWVLTARGVELEQAIRARAER